VKGDLSAFKMTVSKFLEEPTTRWLIESLEIDEDTLLEAIRNSDVEGLEKYLSQLGIHFFDVEELDRYLSQAGFKGFAYDIYGFHILFHAEKG